MSDDCRNISDLIIQYGNNTISKENNYLLLNHLAKCGECRKELAIVIAFSQEITNRSKEVPDFIKENAFSMITKEKLVTSNNGFNDLKSSIINLKDALSTTKKSIRFAIQFI